MDLLFLIGIAVAFLAILAATWFLTRKSTDDSRNETSQPRPNRVLRPEISDTSIPRRAQIARNQRHRSARASDSQTSAVADAENSESDGDATESRPNPFAEEKIGSKKRAKLEAKAEKRQQREAEQQAREDRKKKDNLIEEERRKDEQRETELERKREEYEQKAREELERKEHDEYLKLKAAFQVEEEGYDECDEEEKENLLRSFITYIQENKVVVLEDLATQFKLKTQAVISRITDLQESGTLTGVIDDQGKFIYISDKELADIGSFIQQRGRVSITELAESSNNLINLKPSASAVASVAT